MEVVKAGFLEELSEYDCIISLTEYSSFLKRHFICGVLKREWKKRYFILCQDGLLLYCDKPDSEYCDVAFNVKNRQKIDYGNEMKKNLQHKSPGRVQCMFYIRSSVKKFCLRAENEQDAR